VVFADKMMFPEGCLWHEGSLYVAAPPEIWKLTDTDDDGVADQREVWYDGKTLTGCANDLHGPYLGPDGWFYFCKGAFAEQKHTIHDKPFTTRASHIFRARPDGSGLEPVLTGGMDNPVNVAFLSTGERILSCTFFQFPAAGKRDGLIHAIYGGVYGKKHDSIYEHKMTGDVMPVLVHEGAAAPCGLIAGSDVLFGGGHVDNLFACYFNLHKVVQHELILNGATFKTIDRDFVACDHPDFHPTDVFEDADGSLIVVDTGGWYKVCCPTSQLAKPDVLGAIYRVRKKGQPKVDDPLGMKIAWNALTIAEKAKLLSDQRLFVKKRANREAGFSNAPFRADSALRELIQTHPDSAVRRWAVWSSTSLAKEALASPDRSVRYVAIQRAGLHHHRQVLPALLAVLTEDDPALCRAAAEAVGRIVSDRTLIEHPSSPERGQQYQLEERKAVPALFDGVERMGDFSSDDSGAPADDSLRIREHSLIYALIEIGDAKAVAKELDSRILNRRRAALVALDQMDGGNLQPEQVIPLLDHPQPILRNTATWIVSHRPQWGEQLVAYFQKRLAQPPKTDAEQTQLAGLLARLARSPAIQQCILEQLCAGREDAAQPIALRAMTEAGLTATPPTWLDELARLLTTDEGPLLAQSIAAARQLPLPKGGHAALKMALIDVGRRSSADWALRLDALSIAGALPAVDADTFQLLLSSLGPNEPMAERSAAATILGSAAITPDQQQALLEALAQVGPLELPKLLPAFERGPNEAFGLKLVAALRDSPGFRGLRADLVKALLAKFPATVQEAGQPLLVELNASAAEQAAQLDELLKVTSTGDVRRGHEVFLGKKAQCINCHTLGYQGGRLGPDLTNIGRVRNERDLLESILFPSATLVRGYEPVVIELDDGRTLSGIITRESREEVVLAIDHQKTQHVARTDIADIQPAQVSLMPLGIEKLLSRQELMDLVAFLKQAQR
jgi:putative heme-binding domain-containing protein